MKETLNAIRVAIFFLVGIALIYVVYTTLGRRDLTRESGYRVIALFNDMSTLSTDADVRMAGVKIGRVVETDLYKGQGKAVIVINERYADIPADSVASIALGNLLGQNYVDIKYGNPDAGFLKDGDQLATKPTASVAAVLEQLNDLGSKLNNMADSFGGAGGAGGPFAKIDELIESNRQKIETMLDNLNAITGDLREGKGTLGKLLQTEEAHDAMLAAAREIQRAAEDAQKTFANAQQVFAQVESGQGTLGKLLYDDSIALKIDQTVGNLQEFSEKLNSGQGTLGQLVNDDTLYRELRALLSQAEQSLSAMSDSGPISAVGAAAGALF